MITTCLWFMNNMLWAELLTCGLLTVTVDHKFVNTETNMYHAYSLMNQGLNPVQIFEISMKEQVDLSIEEMCR